MIYNYDYEDILDRKEIIIFGIRQLQVCVIEKALKGFIVKDDSSNYIPHIHNLTKLSKQAGLYIEMSEYSKDTLDILDPLNIETRYPSEKEKLIASLTTVRCE